LTPLILAFLFAELLVLLQMNKVTDYSSKIRDPYFCEFVEVAE